MLLAIRAYQRHLSPRKGFSCAYRVHTGCASCSQVGYRAIQRYGLPGLAVLRQRLTRCGDMHRRHHPPRPVNYQAGECDIGGCDSGACDACSNCGSCDWPSRRRKDPKPRGPLF